VRPINALRLRRASASSGGDPYWVNVVYLAGFESIGGSSITDESSFAHAATFTAASGFGATTAQSKFGAQSLRCVALNGTLTYADSADWAFGSGAFTVECWIRVDNAATGNQHLMGQYDPGTNQRSWALSYGTGNIAIFLSSAGLTSNNTVTGAWTPTANTWYHVAVDFDGTKYRVYADGVMRGSSTTTVALFNASSALAIGSILSSGANGSNFLGYLDEVRITKGVARYASDTGYTVPTAAYPRS
jgi:hypothetical protein